MRQPPDRRQVGRSRSPGSHQYPGTSGNLFCPQILSFKSKEQGGLSKNGQYHSCGLPKHGRYPFSPASTTDPSDLGVVREQKIVSTSATHSQEEQCRSGQRIASTSRPKRLETVPNSNSTADQTLPSSPIYFSSDPSAETVCQLETGSNYHSCRCLHDELVQGEGLCLPTIQPNPSSPVQNQK